MGMGPMWMERSMGMPAVMSACKNPGARVRGHLARWRERTSVSLMRISLRPTSTLTVESSSTSLGEPPSAEASMNIRSVRPFRG